MARQPPRKLAIETAVDDSTVARLPDRSDSPRLNVDVFDLTTDELIAQVGRSNYLGAPVLVDGQVWVSSGEFEAPHTVTVVDPVELTARYIDLGTSLANPAAVGDGIAWISHFSESREDGITSIDTTTLEVIEVDLHGSTAWATGIDGNLWTTQSLDRNSGELIVKSPEGKLLATFEIAPDALEPVVGDGVAWVPNGSEDEVIAIDIATLTELSRTVISGEPLGAAFVDGRVWIDDMNGNVSAIATPSSP